MKTTSAFLALATIAVVVGLVPCALAVEKEAVYISREAEDFEVMKGDWKVGDWGTNLYAASFAISFLSRQQYLGAPPQGGASIAVTEVDVPKTDTYMPLVRYESCWRFNTEFRIQIEQDGKKVFDQLYGNIHNYKVLAFSKYYIGMEEWPPEGGWVWGVHPTVKMGRSQPGEETAWEGTEYKVQLKPGKAKITLIAEKQPEPAARRIIDRVILTNTEEDIQHRLKEESYLPLDGLCTREGDLYLKVKNNAGSPKPIIFSAPLQSYNQMKSPHGQAHIFKTKEGKLIGVNGEGADKEKDADWLQPGQESPWVEIGSLFDALSDCGWAPWSIVKDNSESDIKPDCTLTFGSPSPDGEIQVIRTMKYSVAHDKPYAGLATFGIWGNLRQGYEIQTRDEMVGELCELIGDFPEKGKTPELLIVEGGVWQGHEVLDAMGFKYQFGRPTVYGHTFGHPPVRTPKGVREWCDKQKGEGIADGVIGISLGDEVWADPRKPVEEDHPLFREYLKEQGLKPSDIIPGATSWDEIEYIWPEPTHVYSPKFWHKRHENPVHYYWAHRFGNITSRNRYFKERTDVLSECLPGRVAGANYSPHPNYWPKAQHCMLPYRDKSLTLVWGEDWLFQIPTTSPQIIGFLVDAYKSAARYHDMPITMYVMNFYGNTPNGFRRCFYNDVARAVKYYMIPDMSAAPMSYSEGYLRAKRSLGNYEEAYNVLHEAGLFEDIIYHGDVKRGEVAMLISESSEMWYRTPLFNAEKQHIWMALKGHQYEVDFVLEDDIAEGDLDKYGYKTLYICDPCVTEKASKVIADWVKRGGHLFVTAGGAMQNEFDQPNTVLRDLLAIEPKELELKRHLPMFAGKDMLPLEEPMDTVKVKAGFLRSHKLPALFMRQKFDLTEPKKAYECTSDFASGGPAIARRKVGEGGVTYAGFFVGTAYVKPALPKRPADRAHNDDAFVHFIPTEFDKQAKEIILKPVKDAKVYRPIETKDLVEVSWVEAPAGVAVTVINYTDGPIDKLKVRVKNPGKVNEVELATEQEVKWDRDGDDIVVTLPLEVADVIMLRY